MLKFFRLPWKKRWFLLLLPLVLLCGCSSLEASQAVPTPTTPAQQNALTPTSTATAQQVSSTPTATQQASPTAAAQATFASYVGKWEVHGSLLTISANHTGLEQWNVGPCSDAGQMCNGNSHITFTVNTDGSIKGSVESVNYTQWNGDPAPAGFQPDASDPQAGDTFQLQHSGSHLLYTTWFGKSAQHLNNGNRYWCDTYALQAGWKQCGA